MCNKESKKFKKFIKEKEQKYYKDLNKKIRNLKSTNPKEYWKLLNKDIEGRQERTKISLETFFNHFKDLGGGREINRTEADNITEGHDPEIINENFDFDFTVEEIMSNIKNLKNNKACGLDHIRNEFLKHLSPRLLFFVNNLFNLILQTGIIPAHWCKGMIMPLYKRKGSQEDPNNFRGITLLSCIGKLFTACLNTRIANFLHLHNKIGPEQAGFRPGFSTLDHIFTLHCIIEYYKSKHGRVYCAFVDYSKAFDLIERSALWGKLLQHGINGRVLRVVYSIYQNTKSCIKSGGKISNFFTCNTGVRQGENLSPLLFAIYLNDFQETMAKSYSGLKALNEQLTEELDIMFKMYLLLYADDTIIMSESAGELQTALNALHDYCQKWSLKVNIDKTKIIIFSRGRVKKHPIFTLGNREIMVEEEYKYLGVVFNYNGSFKKAIGQQIIQSRKAMFGLLERAKKLRLPIDITCELFDRVVTPILLYGCEVWGMSDIRDVEIFHRSFLRIMLKTFKFTPNCMLYGETGTTDLYTVVKNRMINFWAKLKFGDQNKLSSIMLRLLDKLQLEQPEKFSFKWITQIKGILENTGFSEVWTADSIDSDLFKIVFKQRCDDIFKQTWLTDMMNNSQCTEYRKMKELHEFENYLIELEPSDRIALSKFRTRTHHLPVTHTRFQGPGAKATNCPLCPLSEVGDESHYLLRCPYFSSERDKFIPSYPPSMKLDSSLHLLFHPGSSNLKDLAKFVKIVISKFKYSPQIAAESMPRGKISKFSRSGREIISPTRLNLWTALFVTSFSPNWFTI